MVSKVSGFKPYCSIPDEGSFYRIGIYAISDLAPSIPLSHPTYEDSKQELLLLLEEKSKMLQKVPENLQKVISSIESSDHTNELMGMRGETFYVMDVKFKTSGPIKNQLINDQQEGRVE